MKRKQRTPKSLGRRIWQFQFGTKFRAFISLMIFLSVIVLAYVIYLSRDLPSLSQLEEYEPELATQVISADGVVIKQFYTQRRSYTPLSRIPKKMKQAVLAVEDHRFYSHWGMVPIRLLKALAYDIMTMRPGHGASTLTQQLARQLYLTLEKTVKRKIKELLTAVQIERTYTKDEIFEMYLNQMSFGHGTYGVESAAQLFFKKSIRELSLAEIALIAGQPQLPAVLNPFKYPERALRRRNIVLQRMLAEKFINREEYDQAASAELTLAKRFPQGQYGIAPYFTEYVRQELQKRYGWDLYKGGMKVYTTLDTRVQAAAEAAVKKHLPKQQKKVTDRILKKGAFEKFIEPSLLKEKGLQALLADSAFVDSVISARAAVQTSLVAMEVKTGHILAMIGGRDFGESQFNRVMQTHRQPGSVFKPIVYAAAVDNGYMPCYEFLDQPVTLPMVDGTRWTPPNYDGTIGGKTPLREGLRLSRNLVTARLALKIGPQRIVEYAKRLGLTTEVPPYPAIALGTADVYPIEIVTAFGAFANLGTLTKPIAILRVEDKHGNVLERAKLDTRDVIPRETAYIMADMLRTVASRGTGASMRSVYQFLRPAGGKTGTTNDYTDAWFVGFTPQIVAGVWVGIDNPAMSLGPRQSGAVAALPIWAPFMKAAHDTLHLPVENFIEPSSVVRLDICNETKQLAGEFCPEIVNEIFSVEAQPTVVCQKHLAPGKQSTRTSKKKRGPR